MWFKVDDSFHSHPKALEASLAALGLWTLAGSWSGDHRQDGFVSDQAVRLLSRGAIELADELVSAGLWKRTKGGYRFHQWEQRNPTRSDCDRITDRKASGGSLGNHLRWHTKRGEQNPDCQFCQEKQASDLRSESDRSTDQISDRTPNPDPTRPEESSSNSLLPDPDGTFEEFWQAYPPRKNNSKHKARLAYHAALKRGVDPDLILAHVKDYARDRAGQDQQFTKHAVTWLHARPWEEPEQLAPPPRAKFAWEA